MTSLERFTPYTSHRLHWFPYELTRVFCLTRQHRQHTLALWQPQLPASVPGTQLAAEFDACRRPHRPRP